MNDYLALTRYAALSAEPFNAAGFVLFAEFEHGASV
jgi:hypothetical protein